jgi:hypothetical protein
VAFGPGRIAPGAIWQPWQPPLEIATVPHTATISAVGALATAGGGSVVSTLPVSPTAVGDLFVFVVRNFQHTATLTSVTGGGVTTWTKLYQGIDGSGSDREFWIGRITATGAATITVTWSSTPPTLTELMAQQFTSTAGASANWAVVAGQATGQDNASSTTPPFPALTASADGQLYYGHMAFWGTGTAGTTSGFTWVAALSNNQIAYHPNVTAGTVQPSANQTNAVSYPIAALITDADSATATNATAGVATGAGSANAATVNVGAAAEAAAGVGTANAPTATVGPAAGVAAGTGTANAATANVAPVAGNAAGTGTANNPTVSAVPTATATAGVATGTGVANAATASIAATAGVAAGHRGREQRRREGQPARRGRHRNGCRASAHHERRPDGGHRRRNRGRADTDAHEHVERCGRERHGCQAPAPR